MASNLPGLVLHIWLNSGAARLQYLEIAEAKKERQAISRQWDASSPVDDTQDESEDHTERENEFAMVPQERMLLRLLSVWAVVLVYCAWFSRADPAKIVGYVVNVNLIVFYGAPLQTMQLVIETANAESIHTPTMIMNWVRTISRCQDNHTLTILSSAKHLVLDSLWSCKVGPHHHLPQFIGSPPWSDTRRTESILSKSSLRNSSFRRRINYERLCGRTRKQQDNVAVSFSLMKFACMTRRAYPASYALG